MGHQVRRASSMGRALRQEPTPRPLQANAPN